MSVLLLLYTTGALVGVVVDPLVSLAVAVGGAPMAAVAVAATWAHLTGRVGGGSLPPRQLLALTALLAAAVPFGIGVGAMGRVGSLLALVALALVTLVCAQMLDRITVRPRPAAAPRPVPAPPRMPSDQEVDVLRQLLGRLPVADLCEEWRAATVRAGTDPGAARDPDVQLLRHCLVAELRRRDPDGVARWLREGPHHPPGRFVRDDRDLT